MRREGVTGRIEREKGMTKAGVALTTRPVETTGRHTIT